MERNPEHCQSYWHRWSNMSPGPILPVVWQSMCHKCIKRQIQDWTNIIERDKKDKIDHGNYKTMITKARKVLKQYYLKNPDLALED